MIDQQGSLKVRRTILGILANDRDNQGQSIGFVRDLQRQPGLWRYGPFIGFDDSPRVQHQKANPGIVDTFKDTKRGQGFAFNQNETLCAGKPDEAFFKKDDVLISIRR